VNLDDNIFEGCRIASLSYLASGFHGNPLLEKSVTSLRTNTTGYQTKPTKKLPVERID